VVAAPPAAAARAPIADASKPATLPPRPAAGAEKPPAPEPDDLVPPPAGAGTGKVVATSPDAVKPPVPAATVPAAPVPSVPTAPSSPPTSWNSGRPVGQVTNNRRVTLEYEVAKIGPSRVGSVELYVTRDDGLTWARLSGEHGVPGDGRGQELRRTISVDLPDDGVYGFHLLVKSGAGLSKPAPRSGDAPQMRLELDTKLPTAELYRPELNPAAADALLISWKAGDKNLSENPIRLQWAERPTGPWEDIGGPALANTGSHSWRVGGNVPPKVYLRLSVRDNAGNIAVAETPEPILVDLSTPEVKSLRLVGGQ
jgi:hypothetical protein